MKPSLVNAIEKSVFSIRWMLIPLYIGLVFAEGLYITHFLHEIIEMFHQFMVNYEQQNVLMLFILELVDMTMISQLVIMTVQGGYSIFVKEFDYNLHGTRPRWLTRGLGSSEQKIKLGMSIIGIMIVHFLRDFIEGGISEHELYMRMWMFGSVIIGTFSFCAFNLMMHHPMLSHDHKTTDHKTGDSH